MGYSILDASNDFSSLSNDIGLFKKKLCEDFEIEYEEVGVKLFTPSNDEFITLDTIQQYLLSLTAYIRGFMELQEIINNNDRFLEILKLGVTKDQLEGENGQYGIIYAFPIESLVVMIHFKIDSYFGKICGGGGFYAKMCKVLDTLNIKCDKEDKEDFKNTLKCLSSFRNSFHNGRVHLTNKENWKNRVEPKKGIIDMTFEQGDLKIEFKHKEAIVYNWKSAYLLINKSVSVLEELIYLQTSRKKIILHVFTLKSKNLTNISI